MPARDPRTRARVVAFAAIAFFLVGGIGRLALGAALTEWDQRVMLAVAADRSGETAGWMGVLSAIGHGSFAISAGVAVFIVLLLRQWWRSALCYGVTVLTGWGLNALLKEGFRRHRPDIIPRLDGAGWYSFPSGHAMLAPLVFGLGAFLLTRDSPPMLRRAGRTAAVLLCLSIAFSRVYLGVHYPSDVVGALLAGTGWAALGVAVYSPLEPHPSPAPLSASTPN
jgi:undecaprenyl-diphosphatase